MTKDITIIRFMNGEEIIGTVKNSTQETLEVENIAAIMLVPDPTKGGVKISMGPFMPYAENKTFTFPLSLIMTTGTPGTDLLNYYNQIFGSGLVMPSRNPIIKG